MGDDSSVYFELGMKKVKTRYKGKANGNPLILQKKRNGYVGWLVLSFALVLCTLVFDSRLLDSSNIVRFVATSFFLTGCSVFFVRKSLRYPANMSLLASLLLLLLMLLSMAWADNVQEALFESVRFGVALSLFLLSYNLFAKHPIRSVVWMSRVSFIVFVLAMGMALLQIDGAGDMRWNSRYCVTSLFTHKSTFSMMLVLISAFPAMRILMPIKKSRWLYVLVLVGALSMIAFLQSRAVLIAIVVAGFVALLSWLFRRMRVTRVKKNVVSVAFALIMGGVLMSGSYWFSHLDDLGARDASGIRSNASFYERQTLWTTTFRMVQEKPLAGCGAGNWKVSHPSASVRDIFSVDILDFNFVRPHNEYLKVISELGIIGLVLMMLIISSFFVDAFWGAVGRNRIIVSVGSSVIGGLCTFAVFDFPFDRMETLCWTMLIAGCVCARCAHPAKRVDAYFIKGSITIALFCACLLGCGRWYSEKCVKSILGYVHRGVWNKVEMLSREAYKPWVNLTTNGIPVAYYEAMSLEYQGKSALEAFRRAYHDAPYNKQVLTDLGRLEYVEAHRVDVSIELLKEAIRISPSYSYAYFNLAQVYILEGRISEARSLLSGMDFQSKQAKIDALIWQYHQGEDVVYYQEQVVPAEQEMRDHLLFQLQ